MNIQLAKTALEKLAYGCSGRLTAPNMRRRNDNPGCSGGYAGNGTIGRRSAGMFSNFRGFSVPAKTPAAPRKPTEDRYYGSAGGYSSPSTATDTAGSLRGYNSRPTTMTTADWARRGVMVPPPSARALRHTPLSDAELASLHPHT